MKRFFCITALCLITSLSYVYGNGAEEPVCRQNWPFFFDIYGDVEKVTLSAFDCDEHFGELQKGEYLYGYYVDFNTRGDVVLMDEMNSDGLDGKSKYNYDQDGRLLEEIVYDEDGDVESKKRREYNQDGKLVKEVYQHRGGRCYCYTYEYDKNGNLVEEICDDNGDWSRKRYQYNAKGCLEDVYEYTEPNSIYVRRTNYTYNGKGLLRHKYVYEWIYVDDYQKDTIIAESTTWTYDTNGRVVEEVHKEGDCEPVVVKYLYDAEGTLVEVEEIIGEWVVKQVYNYVNGVLADITRYSNGIIRFKMTCCFDANDKLNPSKMVFYESELLNPVQIVEIDVTYRSKLQQPPLSGSKKNNPRLKQIKDTPKYKIRPNDADLFRSYF